MKLIFLIIPIFLIVAQTVSAQISRPAPNNDFSFSQDQINGHSRSLCAGDTNCDAALRECYRQFPTNSRWQEVVTCVRSNAVPLRTISITDAVSNTLTGPPDPNYWGRDHTITITGSNFGAQRGQGYVQLEGQTVSNNDIREWTDTRIVVINNIFDPIEIAGNPQGIKVVNSRGNTAYFIPSALRSAVIIARQRQNQSAPPPAQVTPPSQVAPPSNQNGGFQQGTVSITETSCEGASGTVLANGQPLTDYAISASFILPNSQELPVISLSSPQRVAGPNFEINFPGNNRAYQGYKLKVTAFKKDVFNPGNLPTQEVSIDCNSAFTAALTVQISSASCEKVTGQISSPRGLSIDDYVIAGSYKTPGGSLRSLSPQEFSEANFEYSLPETVPVGTEIFLAGRTADFTATAPPVSKTVERCSTGSGSSTGSSSRRPVVIDIVDPIIPGTRVRVRVDGNGDGITDSADDGQFTVTIGNENRSQTNLLIPTVLAWVRHSIPIIFVDGQTYVDVPSEAEGNFCIDNQEPDGVQPYCEPVVTSAQVANNQNPQQTQNQVPPDSQSGQSQTPKTIVSVQFGDQTITDFSRGYSTRLTSGYMKRGDFYFIPVTINFNRGNPVLTALRFKYCPTAQSCATGSGAVQPGTTGTDQQQPAGGQQTTIPRYNCNGAACVADPNGPYTDAQCNQRCVQSTGNIQVTCTGNNGNPGSGTTGQPVTWDANATGGYGTYAYQWSGTDNLGGGGEVQTFTYNTPGQKTATVNVTTSTGQTGRATCSVNIAQGQTATTTSSAPIVVQGASLNATGGQQDFGARINANGRTALASPTFRIEVPAQGSGYQNITVTSTTPSNMTVGYSACVSGTNCTMGTFTSGASFSRSVPPGATIDVWWRYNSAGGNQSVPYAQCGRCLPVGYNSCDALCRAANFNPPQPYGRCGNPASTDPDNCCECSTRPF